MPSPADRPAPVTAGAPALPLLILAAFGVILAGAVFVAGLQTRPAGLARLPPPVQSEEPPIPPALPPLPAPQAAQPAPPPAPVKPGEPTKLAPVGAEADSGVAVPDRYEVVIRIERGDTMAKLLEDLGFAPDERARADTAFRKVLKGPRLPEGETVTVQLLAVDPSQPPVLQQLAIRPRAEREVILQRREDGSYEAQEKIYQVSPRLVRATGSFANGIRGGGEAAGVPAAVMTELTRAFAYDVDFQRDIQKTDRFHVLIEQAVTSDGRIVHSGRMVWAELELKRGKLQVYRFRPDGGAEQFYTARGESVVRSFLRTPMDLSRVSSRFGLREHPILGFTAMHAGVDFAAAYGTPVLAAGAGKVEMAGANGGYGNYVRLRHTHEVATAYAHLASFAPGIRPGATVRQGQVIGFVGSTGMSTGPHLHYEFHRRGAPVNPLTQKVSMRNQLAGRDLARFNARASELHKARSTAMPVEPQAAPPAAALMADRTPTPDPARPVLASTGGEPVPAVPAVGRAPGADKPAEAAKPAEAEKPADKPAGTKPATPAKPVAKPTTAPKPAATAKPATAVAQDKPANGKPAQVQAQR